MNSHWQVIRDGTISLKGGGFPSFMFLRKWLVLKQDTLTIHKTKFSLPQNTIMLHDVTNIERVDLKPYCLLLVTKDKRYHLTLKNDEELYGWHDDIYSRSPLVGINNPTDFVHKVHVGFDPLSGTFTGMPKQWSKLLMQSTITREDYAKDPQAVLDVLEFHTDHQKRELPCDDVGEREPDQPGDLEKTADELRQELATAYRKERSLNRTIQSLRGDFRAWDSKSKSKIAHLEKTVQELRQELAASKSAASQKEIDLTQLVQAHEQKHHCETLYSEGRMMDAALSFLEMTSTANENVRANKLFRDWIIAFTDRCAMALEKFGDEASRTDKHDEAIKAYSTLLSLSSFTPNNVLTKWASMVMARGSASEALHAATKFRLPQFTIYRVIGDMLVENGDVKEAVTYLRRMPTQIAADTAVHSEQVQWKHGFQRQCSERLEKLGDAAMDSQNYDEAIEYFSAILSLDAVDRVDPLIKRSHARVMMKLWEDALSDANEAVKLDPSSYRGYERRHAALHGARRYSEAVEAFDMMLVKLDQSPHEHIRRLRRRYIDARPMIRCIINRTIYSMPRVLIDATTGRLHDKKHQVKAFEVLPVYSELVSSMTGEIDHARILRTVKEFYRYVMLSHTWENEEPLLQKFEDISIYELEASPTYIKLQKFCSLARSLGFRWAWSDTSCVDKSNNVVLQESLVAMFTWYRGSSLTIVYLRGVSSDSRLPGGLQGSIWNTRGWTYQEYVAAETVQFYTEDWEPYLGLTMYNHKESPMIVSEMQQATGVSAREMAVLQPGLDRVREKLCLASMRHTTLTEDIAYSLLGIFNVAIPVIYGEGDRAVGRLLEHILTGSGDVTILAWTGRAGSYNSCLPVDLTVYNQLVPPHVPPPIAPVEMDSMVMALRSSLGDPSLAVTLHSQLKALPSPSLAASRLRLPAIVFRLGELVHTSPNSETRLHVYHATTPFLGNVEITTADDSIGTHDLYLVHPWIRPLLDQEFSQGTDALDKTTQALRFVVRLWQPFGALLLESLSRVEYKRVAADSLIMVQLRDEVSLTELIENVRTVDIQ